MSLSHSYEGKGCGWREILLDFLASHSFFLGGVFSHFILIYMHKIPCSVGFISSDSGCSLPSLLPLPVRVRDALACEQLTSIIHIEEGE